VTIPVAMNVAQTLIASAALIHKYLTGY